jgi:type II secretory pathway pseudopilin PulG
MKTRGGFSYIEIVMAAALLAILLAVALPMTRGAAHNLDYARRAYAAQLEAQRILLAYRDGVAFSSEYDYSIYIFKSNGKDFLPFDLKIEMGGLPPHFTAVIVLVYNQHGYPWGRAVGVFP